MPNLFCTTSGVTILSSAATFLCNSIVFRAGDAPVWNRNETILPMSWRLFKDTIKKPGKEFSLQTIPTLSSAKDFDIRQNQPNFERMVEKRMQQAIDSISAIEDYKRGYNISNDDELSRLDPDVLSEDIMSIVFSSQMNNYGAIDFDSDDIPDGNFDEGFSDEYISDNTEVMQEIERCQQIDSSKKEKKYCLFDNKYLFSDDDFKEGVVSSVIEKALRDSTVAFNELGRRGNFEIIDDKLYGNGKQPFILCYEIKDKADVKHINDAGKDPASSVYNEGNIDGDTLRASYMVLPAFLDYLKSSPDWESLTTPKFVSLLAAEMDV